MDKNCRQCFGSGSYKLLRICNGAKSCGKTPAASSADYGFRVPEGLYQLCGYEAFFNAANGIEGPISIFCQNTGSTLKNCGWLTPREAIDKSFAELESQIALTRTDKEVLQALGANLGNNSKSEQYAYLSLVQEQLRIFEREAILKRDQNMKMYRYLGIFSGLAIVIVLV